MTEENVERVKAKLKALRAAQASGGPSQWVTYDLSSGGGNVAQPFTEHMDSGKAGAGADDYLHRGEA